MRRLLCTILLPALVALVAVADPDANSGDPERGKALFSDTQDGDYASCAMCHSLLPEKEESKTAKHLGPGATLYGAVVRQGWRNMNTYKDVAEASQRCAKWWQERSGGLKARQQADLIAFLKQHAPEGTLPKREVQRKPKLLGDLDGGDAAKGKALTERYCVQCHNPGDDALSFKFKPGKRKKLSISRKVRGYTSKGKFKPQDSTMSFYTQDRLSDEDLKHILAYLGK